jgi:hypothetical protein
VQTRARLIGGLEMAEPTEHARQYRVVRITKDDLDNPAQLERILQPLYMMAEPVVDLSGFDGPVDGLASQLKHLNRYHTSRGAERLRIVADSTNVRRLLGDGAGVFRFYDTLEEALTTN